MSAEPPPCRPYGCAPRPSWHGTRSPRRCSPAPSGSPAGRARRPGSACGGELVDAQLPAAAEHIGLAADEDGAAEASEAWRLAVDTGLVDVEDPGEDAGPDAEGAARAGANLALVTGGSPKDVLSIWLDGLEAVHADATAPVFDDLADLVGEDGSIDFESLDWDPEIEAEFLDGVLGNLYLLTVGDGHGGTDPAPYRCPPSPRR